MTPTLTHIAAGVAVAAIVISGRITVSSRAGLAKNLTVAVAFGIAAAALFVAAVRSFG
jgi:hypothetical protein